MQAHSQPLYSEFERCRPWLEAALEYNGGHQTIGQVYEGVVNGDYWFIHGKDFAAVLEPSHTGTKKVLNWFLAGGNLEGLQHLEQVVAREAKKQGFDCLMIVGRRGWVKRLDGYKETAVILEKQL